MSKKNIKAHLTSAKKKNLNLVLKTFGNMFYRPSFFDLKIKCTWIVQQENDPETHQQVHL